MGKVPLTQENRSLCLRLFVLPCSACPTTSCSLTGRSHSFEIFLSHEIDLDGIQLDLHISPDLPSQWITESGMESDPTEPRWPRATLRSVGFGTRVTRRRQGQPLGYDLQSARSVTWTEKGRMVG